MINKYITIIKTRLNPIIQKYNVLNPREKQYIFIIILATCLYCYYLSSSFLFNYEKTLSTDIKNMYFVNEIAYNVKSTQKQNGQKINTEAVNSVMNQLNIEGSIIENNGSLVINLSDIYFKNGILLLEKLAIHQWFPDDILILSNPISFKISFTE